MPRYGTEQANFPVCCDDAPAPSAPACSCLSFETMTVPSRICWDQLIANVQYEAKGVPAEVAADYVRTAAAQFTNDVRVLKRKWLITPQRTVTDYYPCIDKSEELIVVDTVTVDGACRFKNEEHCGPAMSRGYFDVELPGTIHISADEAGEFCGAEHSILVTGWVKVSEVADEVDELLFRYHRRTIDHLALSHLFAIPERRWSNTSHARYHLDRYHALRSNSRADLEMGAVRQDRLAFQGMRF